MILDEILKFLSGAICEKECERSIDGFFCRIKVRVPTSKSSAISELVGYSPRFCSAEIEAAESAAEDLIFSLKKACKIEVDDLNWSLRNESELRRAVLDECIENLKRENNLLKEFVTSVVDGWASSLQLVDSVHKVSEAVCLLIRTGVRAYMCDDRVVQAVSKAEALKQYVKFIWSEGANSFDRVLTCRESVYRP